MFESSVNDNKKKSLRILLLSFYLAGFLAIVMLTINSYQNMQVMTDFKLKLFRNTTYLALLSVFCLSIWLFSTNIKIEKKFVLIAGLFGICYMFIMTPFSIPDEPFHYNTSYVLSNKLMFEEEGYGYVSQLDASAYPFEGHKNVQEGYISLIDNIYNLNLFSQSNELIKFNENRLVWTQYFMQYLPQALGITAARLVNGNLILLFYSARLFNLIFYVFCGYFAIRKLSQVRTNFTLTMFLIGIMPMVLHQAASVSYDTFGFGFAFLLTSSVLCAIFDKKQLSKSEYAYILLCSVLLSPFKLTYFPLCFLCLLIPKERFKSKKHSYLGKFIVIICSMAFLLLFQVNSMTNVSNMIDRNLYTPSFIIDNPLQTIMLICRTVGAKVADYFLGAIGNNMSGLSLWLPEFISLTYLVVLLISTTGKNDDSLVLSAKQKLFSFCIICVITLLIHIGLMLHWTNYGSFFIQGVQPRYFIPVFPLFFVSLKNKIFICEKEIDATLTKIAVFLQCVTLAYIVTATVENIKFIKTFSIYN